MSKIVIELKPNAKLFTNPNSEEAELQNLLLNIMGGLLMANLSQGEKNLLIKNGYKGKFE